MGTRRLLDFFIGVFAGVILLGSPASGQHGLPPGGTLSVGKIPEAKAWPRGQRELTNVNYTPWRKLCFERSNAKTVCRTTISASTQETGTEIIRIDLVQDKDGPGALLQVFVPPGQLLLAGVSLTVDKNETIKLPFNWCFANACIAAVRVDPRFIQTLKSGRKVKLETVDPALLTVTATLPLDKFGGVNEGPATQMFEESLESK